MTNTPITRNTVKVALGSAIFAAMGVASLAVGAGIASADELDPSNTSSSSTADAGQEPADTPSAPAQTAAGATSTDAQGHVHEDPSLNLASSGIGGTTYTSSQIAAIQDANANLAAAKAQLAANAAPSGSGHEPTDATPLTPEEKAALLADPGVAAMRNNTRDVSATLQEILAAQAQAEKDVWAP